MADVLAGFTPEGWAEAKAILSGDNPDAISPKAAAKAAGVSYGEFLAIVERSRQRNPDDDQWIYEVAEIFDSKDVLQGATLEDWLWKSGGEGTPEPVFYKGELVNTKNKRDNKVALKMLEIRDKRYKPNEKLVPVLTEDNLAEIYRRLSAGKRLAEAKAKQDEAINLTPKVNAQGEESWMLDD